MAARGPRDFPALMGELGWSELLTNPRYEIPILDLDVVREVRGRLDARFAEMTLAEVGDLLRRADVIWAPMASLDEVVADPQAHEAGCFVETPDGWGGSFRAPATPVRFPGAPVGPAGPAPKLGEHTREVLAEAGYAEPEIAQLMAAKIAL